MPESNAANPAIERRPSGCLRLMATLVLMVLLGGGVVFWFFSGWVKQQADRLSSRFMSQHLTEDFRQSITEITSTNGDVLEVAVMRTDETVARHDARSVFNDMVSLGTTVSEIRTPVVYRYHIRLSDPWQLQVVGNRCIVFAPALRPSLPPAIETQGMQKRSEAGWLRFNAAENLAQLERDLTPTLQERAGNPNNLNLVREASRQSIAEFVQKWLLKQDGVRREVESIVVVFPGEAADTASVPASAPAMQLPRP